MIAKSGWLEVRESSGQNGVRAVRKCWCVLDNGVLWLYKKEGEREGRDGLPLHDAVVGECDPPAPFQLAVRCRRSQRVLALTAASKEEYSSWMALLGQTAREWSDKRRASILNKQLQAIALETANLENSSEYNSYEDVKFAPRRKSEVPRPGNPLIIEEEDHEAAITKRSTLREIVDSAKNSTSLRWAKLDEVIHSGLLGLLTEEQVALEELKFAALVEEFRYITELKVLINLATRAVSWDDPFVPPYHKRAIVNSLHKVKKSSEVVLRMAERHWSQKVTLQNAVFTLLGHEARVAAWQQTYTEFCSHLSELRAVFNRSKLVRPEMEKRSYSERYQLEVALVPLQHLTSQRQLLQTIFELLPPDSPEWPAAKTTKEFLNEILDSCYQELTELEGSEYVAEMDNELHFDLSEMTPMAPGPKLLNRQSTQLPAKPNLKIDENDGEEQLVTKMEKSRPSLIVGAFKSAAKAIRRNTSEGDALKEKRRASMPAFAFAATQEVDDSEEEESESEEEKFEPGKVVPRFFVGEPLYQDYLLSIAEETAEDLLQKDEDEDFAHFAGDQKILNDRVCTRWADNFKVQLSNLPGTLSEEERELASVLYELVASEAAYFKSLRTLDTHFAHNTDFYDDDVLPPQDRHVLFSSIKIHKSNCERLLFSMERCWEKDLLLNDLCSVIHCNAISASARAAAAACSNHRIVAPTLQRLVNGNEEFSEILDRMESSHVCGGHTFLSYLALPLKRMGRVRQLLERVKQLLENMDSDPKKMGLRAGCENALAALDRLIRRAEGASKKTLSDQSLQILASRLSFNKVPSLALNAEGRLLLHHADWTVLGRRENGRGAFKPKQTPKELLAFLLSDLLILVDPQENSSSGRLEVFEYSARSDVQVRTIGPGCQEPMPGYLANDPAAKHALYLSFRDQSGRTVEMVVGSENGAEKARWLAAATREESHRPSPPPRRRNPAILRAVKSFSPSLPDELMLTPGDIIALSRNPGNGWAQGKSILDGFSGWFPKDLTVQLCAGRKSVTFLVDEDMHRHPFASNRFSVA